MISDCANALNKYLFGSEKPTFHTEAEQSQYKKITNLKVDYYNRSSLLAISTIALGVLFGSPLLAFIGGGLGIFGCVVIDRSFDKALPSNVMHNTLGRVRGLISSANAERPQPDLSFYEHPIFYASLT